MNTEEIIDFLYKNHYNAMLNYCFSKNIKRTDAEEIINEAFARLLEKYNQFDITSIEILKAWLLKATKNIIMEKLRDSQKNMAMNIDDFYSICNDSDEISDSIENDNYRYYLDHIHKFIGEEDWVIYESKFIKMLDYDEISKKLDMEQSTVRSRISRMRKKLKPFILEMIRKHLFFL